MESDAAPLTFDTLKKKLESHVFMVMTVRRSVEIPAQELTRFTRHKQNAFIQAVEHISQQTHGISPLFLWWICLVRRRVKSMKYVWRR